jgi:hypothetical protein
MTERTGVFVVKDKCGRTIVVWGSVYRALPSQEEYESRTKITIHRSPGSVPILLPKRRRSTFLLSRTIRRFEEENQVICKSVDLRDLDSKSMGAFGVSWARLTQTQCVEILEWVGSDS